LTKKSSAKQTNKQTTDKKKPKPKSITQRYIVSSTSIAINENLILVCLCGRQTSKTEKSDSYLSIWIVAGKSIFCIY